MKILSKFESDEKLKRRDEKLLSGGMKDRFEVYFIDMIEFIVNQPPSLVIIVVVITLVFIYFLLPSGKNPLNEVNETGDENKSTNDKEPEDTKETKKDQ